MNWLHPPLWCPLFLLSHHLLCFRLHPGYLFPLESARYISLTGPWLNIPSAPITISRTSTWLCLHFIHVSAPMSSYSRCPPCPPLHRMVPLSLLLFFPLSLFYCFRLTFWWIFVYLLVVCFSTQRSALQGQLCKVREFAMSAVISSEPRVPSI